MRVVERDRIGVSEEGPGRLADQLKLPVADDFDIFVVAEAALDQPLLVLGAVDEREVEAGMFGIVAAVAVAGAVFQVNQLRCKARYPAKQ